jgi:predicted nucleic acid-binding protein
MTTLAWDTSPILHAGRIDRLDVLGDIASGWPRSVTTAAVAEELEPEGIALPDWLEVVHVDGLAELVSLAEWLGRVSAGKHHRGEATVLAWAEVHHAIAIVDDRDARMTAQKVGLETHGVLWVVANAVHDKRIAKTTAGSFVDAMIASGARYPFEAGGFVTWAQAEGLL